MVQLNDPWNRWFVFAGQAKMKVHNAIIILHILIQCMQQEAKKEEIIKENNLKIIYYINWSTL